MRPLGIDVSCVGIARAYAEFCNTLVIDAVDAHLAPDVEATGVHAIVADTMMRSPEVAANLARHALAGVA
jgi:LPPG:FO 2-phospho-L-lactate transferase